MILLAIGSDNLVELEGLKNEQTGAYVNTATVSMVLRNAALELISGEEAISLGYVLESNGDYKGTLPSSLTLTSGARYFLDVTATVGEIVRFDRIPCRAQYAAGN